MSDLERLLREAGRNLPQPDADATRRARERALGALRVRRSLRRPLVAALAALLLGAGIGIGALIAPSGTASPAPVGFGFLPEPGWYVLQSGEQPNEGWPALAMASNVPFATEDLVRGSAAASGYPLATVESLPRDGVVIVATFTARGFDRFYDAGFAEGPLRVEALQSGSRLRATVSGHNVEVFVYYGTPRPSGAVVASAQRQLDRIVVHSAPARRQVATPAASTLQVVDRTFACPVAAFATLNVWASSPWRPPQDPDLFKGYLAITSGPHPTRPLVYVRQRARPAGGYPSQAGVFARSGSPACFESRRPVPLTTRGLAGPPVQWATIAKCRASGRALVRLRATVQSAGLWQRVNATYRGARGNVAEATVAIRTESGRPLALVKVDRQGRTRLWTSSRCD